MLFSVASLKKYYGIEFRQVEMYVIDIDTRKSWFLGPEEAGPDGDNILYVDPDGRYLLLSARESRYKYPSVFRINIDTNESEEIVKDQRKIWD